VFVLNVVDGCIPSDMATGSPAEVEEERRLLYVAMTRAKDDLYLMVPQRFFTYQQSPAGDRHVYTSRTRFIPSTFSIASPARHGLPRATTRTPSATENSARRWISNLECGACGPKVADLRRFFGIRKSSPTTASHVGK
jgi:DNA helicase-2/ATP-dependent DNA helicase PcrA